MYNFEAFWTEALRAMVTSRMSLCHKHIAPLVKQMNDVVKTRRGKTPRSVNFSKLHGLGIAIQTVARRFDVGVYVGIDFDPPKVKLFMYPVDHSGVRFSLAVQKSKLDAVLGVLHQKEHHV